ncbi:hypothetical protein B0J18DRAFT_82398 [Chaetomium sp. MPI-SDFR-AT-0129]|nr:hypothetical protein B0J18DRAFT_82398 [Chaetomium sp. MPI-SDFR-AT-0129]
MPPEPRTNDRPSFYTMKTPVPMSAVSPQGLAHSRVTSQPYKPTTSTTPISSPRPPPSVGQAHPPKPSPGFNNRGATTTTHEPRPPSPNYFGLAVDHPGADPRDSCLVPRENWSSPSSSVKSFGAAIPKQLPLDANPDFEAFRRQIDANRARASFSLSASHFGSSTGTAQTPPASIPSALQRPRPPKRHTQAGDGSDFPLARSSRQAAESFNLNLSDITGTRKLDRDAESSRGDSVYVPGDSKRSSVLSLNPSFFPGASKHEVPPLKLQAPLPSLGQAETTHLTAVSGTNGRPSPQPSIRSTASLSKPGTAAPLQTAGALGPSMITPTELKALLEGDLGDKLLVLDLRVSPQFGLSRVRGALNLCIPTTLLKRATFNLQKLQQTFSADRDQERFANWRDVGHIVVYDAASSDQRDAVSGMNMIKKFTNEGYIGPASILRGGFNAFATEFPDLVDSSLGGPSPGLSLGHASVSGGLRANVPPVIGGVLLPNANHSPSPFFNNIRQNQDLVDGVGQMDVGVPPGLAPASLPQWLREAAASGDRGKKVSDRFLHIERTEQARMREAYSVIQPADANNEADGGKIKVQLSGIEKGGKNRYKDILPFEHARVKLLGRRQGACDYVNASHLQSTRSHKRYIASQGPLPATFEDFWSVVWDNDVRVIVMLTAESEGGQLKCHPYWKGNDFGPIRLRSLSEKRISLDVDRQRSPPATATGDGMTSSPHSSSPDPALPEVARRRANTATTLGSVPQEAQNQFMFPSQTAAAPETPYIIVRKFALSHAAHPFSPIREITQLHYPSWPDFGAPAQPSHLLALVELSNAMQRSALPLDVSGILSSASVSRRNSDHPGVSAGNHVLATSDSRTPDGGNTSPGWHQSPEAQESVRPMLVHCSAGCGRTGAFCTVDSVIDMLKRQRQHMLHQGSVTNTNKAAPRDCDGDVIMNGDKAAASDQLDIDVSWLDNDNMDLIAQTVEDFRRQRLSTVQSLRQFVLCYETVLEWIRRLQDNGGGILGAHGRSSGNLPLEV